MSPKQSPPILPSTEPLIPCVTHDNIHCQLYIYSMPTPCKKHNANDCQVCNANNSSPNHSNPDYAIERPRNKLHRYSPQRIKRDEHVGGSGTLTYQKLAEQRRRMEQHSAPTEHKTNYTSKAITPSRFIAFNKNEHIIISSTEGADSDCDMSEASINSRNKRHARMAKNKKKKKKMCSSRLSGANTAINYRFMNNINPNDAQLSQPDTRVPILSPLCGLPRPHNVGSPMRYSMAQAPPQFQLKPTPYQTSNQGFQIQQGQTQMSSNLRGHDNAIADKPTHGSTQALSQFMLSGQHNNPSSMPRPPMPNNVHPSFQLQQQYPNQKNFVPATVINMNLPNHIHNTGLQTRDLAYNLNRKFQTLVSPQVAVIATSIGASLDKKGRDGKLQYTNEFKPINYPSIKEYYDNLLTYTCVAASPGRAPDQPIQHYPNIIGSYYCDQHHINGCQTCKVKNELPITAPVPATFEEQARVNLAMTNAKNNQAHQFGASPHQPQT